MFLLRNPLFQKTKQNTMRFLNSTLFLFSLLLFACSSQSFEDQIKSDLTTKLPSGICDSIPKGSTITNIALGEIVDIGKDMTDVSYELDYEYKGVEKKLKSAMLYIKEGSRYKLAVLGGCDYEMK